MFTMPSLKPHNGPMDIWYFVQDNDKAYAKGPALYRDSDDHWTVKTYTPDGAAHSIIQGFETREAAILFMARLLPVWKISPSYSDTPFIPVILWVYMQPSGQGFSVYDPATKEELDFGSVFWALTHALRAARKALVTHEAQTVRDARKNAAKVSQALTRMERSMRAKPSDGAPLDESVDEDEEE